MAHVKGTAITITNDRECTYQSARKMLSNQIGSSLLFTIWSDSKVRDYFVAMDARILEVHQMTDDQLEALLKEAAESCNQGLQFCETIVAAYDAFWRARTSAPSKRPTPRPTPKPTNKPEIVTVAKTDRPATNNPTIRITTSAPTRTHFALTISDVFTDTSVVNSAYEVPKFKIGIEAMARLSLGGDFVGLFDSKNTRSDIKFDANDPLSSLAAIPARFTFVVSAEITWSGQPGCTDPDIDPPNHLLLCKRTVSKNLYNNDAVDPFITCECANKAESNQVLAGVTQSRWTTVTVTAYSVVVTVAVTIQLCDSHKSAL